MKTEKFTIIITFPIDSSITTFNILVKLSTAINDKKTLKNGVPVAILFLQIAKINKGSSGAAKAM
jgi:hypothetical protein